MEKITVLGHGYRCLARLYISVIILSLSTIRGFGVWNHGRLFRRMKNTQIKFSSALGEHTKGLKVLPFHVIKDIYRVLRKKKETVPLPGIFSDSCDAVFT